MATRAATWREGLVICNPGATPPLEGEATATQDWTLREEEEKTVDDPSAANRNMEIWKIKKLIKSLEVACESTARTAQLRTWDNRNFF